MSKFDALDLLTGLLEHYSPSGEEAAAADFLVSQMQALGFTAQVDACGNPAGWLGEGERELLLLGHIDTVPGVIPVRRDGDRLDGRGAVDAKGPLACFVSAAALASIGDGWRVTVIGAVGEEADSRGARFLLDRQPPQLVMIGEPSGWSRLALGYKGSAWLNYRVQLPLAHTAAAAASACETAVAFWNALVGLAHQHNQDEAKVFDQLTPTLRAMRSASDGFSETAELHIGARLPLSLPPERFYQLAVECARQSDRAVLEMVESIPAFRGEKNSLLVRAFLGAVRQNGGQPSFTYKSGTSDMNLVGPAWGCPIAAYGPGDSSLDHTPEEHILVSEYLAGVQVMRRVIETITHA